MVASESVPAISIVGVASLRDDLSLFPNLKSWLFFRDHQREQVKIAEQMNYLTKGAT
jgi:hypothetical protein